jgi:hypothetical protein
MPTIDVHNGQTLVAEPGVGSAYLSGVVGASVFDSGQHPPAGRIVDFTDSGDYSAHD